MSSTTREIELKQLMLRSFIQGVCIGLGTTIGAGIIIAILTFIVSKLELIPKLFPIF